VFNLAPTEENLLMIRRDFFWRIFALTMFLSLVLVACGGEAPAPDADDPQNPDTSVGVIQWERDPLHVVFRAEVAGGNQDDFYRLTEVPLCTIYGDNRLVWTVENGAIQEVLFDQLTDAQINSFITDLTVTERIYTYEAGFDLRIPSSDIPVYQKITVHVNGVEHVTDDFVGWPNDYDYFERVLEKCRSLATAPRAFVPQGAWISAREVEYTGEIPEIIWEPDAANLYLTEIAGDAERRWIEGNNVAILWNVLYDNNLQAQFNERDVNLEVALQVPGVTLDAPPAPQE
jgi:hypothetical protein